MPIDTYNLSKIYVKGSRIKEVNITGLLEDWKLRGLEEIS